MGNDNYLVERTYFITTSDNDMCLIAVIDLEDNEKLCNMSKEDRLEALMENVNNYYDVVVISKTNRNQVDWLSKNLIEFLSK
jgi:hypothetical protein